MGGIVGMEENIEEYKVLEIIFEKKEKRFLVIVKLAFLKYIKWKSIYIYILEILLWERICERS